jgi:hypothetical protein
MLPLWKYLPKWMTNIINSKLCSQCHHLANKSEIIAVGVRKVKDGMYSFYVEHCCSNCEKRVITCFSKEKQGSPEDLCYLLIENLQQYRKSEKSKQIDKGKNKSPIGDDEVDDFLKFLYNNDDYQEFMNFIGAQDIPNEDIDET